MGSKQRYLGETVLLRLVFPSTLLLIGALRLVFFVLEDFLDEVEPFEVFRLGDEVVGALRPELLLGVERVEEFCFVDPARGWVLGLVERVGVLRSELRSERWVLDLVERTGVLRPELRSELRVVALPVGRRVEVERVLRTLVGVRRRVVVTRREVRRGGAW